MWGIRKEIQGGTDASGVIILGPLLVTIAVIRIFRLRQGLCDASSELWGNAEPGTRSAGLIAVGLGGAGVLFTVHTIFDFHDFLQPPAYSPVVGEGTTASLITATTTLCAMMAAALCAWNYRRLQRWLPHMDRTTAGKNPRTKDGGFKPWGKLSGDSNSMLKTLNFHLTPFSAPYEPFTGTGKTQFEHRLKQRQGLSMLIASIRWLALFAMMFALFGIFAAYSFPIAHLNEILTLNTVLVVLIAVVICVLVVSMEKDPLLSAFFMDGTKDIEWRTSFFIWAVGPLLAIPVAYWVATVPGVRQWTEGAILPFIGLLTH